MQKMSKSSQNGFVHIIAIVAAVILVGGLGYVGYRTFSNNGLGGSSADRVARIMATKECMDEYDDADLCKFLNSWNDNQKVKIVTSSTIEGQTNTSTVTVDGDKSHMKIEGEIAMETITIGDTYYTKAGDFWWKQTTPKAEDTNTSVGLDDYDFKEPNEETEEKDLTKFVKSGKEACGDKNCFKYQIVDPENVETTEYIWFDDKEYLIRKSLSEGAESRSESVFSYEGISIAAPSSVKELGPNQYIVSGQSEPQTMHDMNTSSEAEIQEMIEEYSE